MVIFRNRFSDWSIRLYTAGLLCCLSLAAHAAVEVELDRNSIVEGETVTLTFTTDDARQSLDADFSPIEKDFEILDRRSETQLSIVNGRQAAVVRLVMTVEPKRSGELEIPAIVFDDSSTRPLALQVDPAPELAPGELPPVFIEVEVSPKTGPYYVHAQFGLIVRVFYQQNLTEAAISPPEPSPASVRLLQETPYQADRGGERYRVLERNYAIFPERSGELIIPRMQLSGRLVERRSTGVWQPSVRGRRVSVTSEELRLDIEPKPSGFSGKEWQPAREFRLTQQISSSDALRVGEPVTRTIIVDAIGLEENMIVEPAWPDIPAARIYPDQPQGITRDDGQWVLGHKEFRYAVVPEQEGELVLPELTVEWWDTASHRQRTAVLPAHTLLVQPSALVPPPAPASAVPPPGAADLAQLSTGPGVHEPAYWRWLTLLFAGLWLLTLFFTWRMRSGRAEAREKAEEPRAISQSEAELLHSMQRACESGDRRTARRVLQRWLREFGPDSSGSLLEFASSLGADELRRNIQALDAEGFRPAAAESWNGKATWKQFSEWRKNWLARGRESAAPLTDLYAKENRQA
jgi:hypothetical protein